jgi:hypothetical protein
MEGEWKEGAKAISAIFRSPNLKFRVE